MSHGSIKAFSGTQFGQIRAVSLRHLPLGIPGSVLLALALLGVTAGVVVLERNLKAQPAIEQASTTMDTAPSSLGVASLELTAPRVPQRPVEALERIDLSTVVRNTTDEPMSKLALELDVLQSDGTRVMTARQSGLALGPHDSRAIYWSWRVPGQLGGSYVVQVHAFDANGRELSSDGPGSAMQIIKRAD